MRRWLAVGWLMVTGSFIAGWYAGWAVLQRLLPTETNRMISRDLDILIERYGARDERGQ